MYDDATRIECDLINASWDLPSAVTVFGNGQTVFALITSHFAMFCPNYEMFFVSFYLYRPTCFSMGTFQSLWILICMYSGSNKAILTAKNVREHVYIHGRSSFAPTCTSICSTCTVHVHATPVHGKNGKNFLTDRCRHRRRRCDVSV